MIHILKKNPSTHVCRKEQKTYDKNNFYYFYHNNNNHQIKGWFYFKLNFNTKKNQEMKKKNHQLVFLVYLNDSITYHVQNSKNDDEQSRLPGGQKDENLSINSSSSSMTEQSENVHRKHYPDVLDLAGMDYSPAMKKPPIHNQCMKIWGRESVCIIYTVYREMKLDSITEIAATFQDQLERFLYIIKYSISFCQTLHQLIIQ